MLPCPLGPGTAARRSVATATRWALVHSIPILFAILDISDIEITVL